MIKKYMVFSLLGILAWGNVAASEQQTSALLALPEAEFAAVANRMDYAALRKFSEVNAQNHEKLKKYFKFRERVFKTTRCPAELSLAFPLKTKTGSISLQEPVRTAMETDYLKIDNVKWGLFTTPELDSGKHTFAFVSERLEKEPRSRHQEIALTKYCTYETSASKKKDGAPEPEHKLELIITDEFMFIDPPANLTEFAQ